MQKHYQKNDETGSIHESFESEGSEHNIFDDSEIEEYINTKKWMFKHNNK